MSTSTIYWSIGSNLGTFRVSNNYDIPVTVVDPNPSLGPVTYTLVSGTLPPSLQLDSATGYLWGYAEYSPQYVTTYSFNVRATKTYNTSGATISTSSNFSIAIKNFIDSNIQWVTTSSLGTIDVGYPSELKVEAKETINNLEVKYNLTNGSLPSGLSLQEDGSIVGQVNYGTTGTFTFTVLANTVYDTAGSSKTFSLNALDSENVKYTKIYIKPFLSQAKRSEYQLFINDPKIFDPSLIYRYFDPNFGVQSELKMILDFGVEQLALDQYTQALRQNYYKRRFTLGKVKSAIATDNNGNTIYEVVYVDVVDNLESVAQVLYANRDISESLSGGTAGQILTEQPLGFMEDTESTIYFPASIKNMRYQLSTIQLDDSSTIKVNRFLEPQFMRTAQPNTLLPSNYIHVVPLCYVTPGNSKQIMKKIAASGFKFNMIDFEIDRIIVQTSLDNASAKYLLFGRESISDTISTDATLYQGDIFWQFDDGVQLTRTS